MDNTIIVFDTAIATSNQGDDIIYESILEQMAYLLDQSYVFRLGTHICNYSEYQMVRAARNFKFKVCDNAKYKLVCGTNLLSHSLKATIPQWGLNRFNKRLYKDSILVGVGSTRRENYIDRYTKNLYKNTLSKTYIHSVRDEQTKSRMENLGFKAVNTGCPTLWCMSKEKCQRIPMGKADKVIITLSGHEHLRNPHHDQILLDIVKSNYCEIYAWIQTSEDEKYLDFLQNSEGIKKVYSLNAYAKLLDNNEIDYVGTRLHGGIFAMQHEKRAIIISIDHRAEGVYQTNKINVIKREEIVDKLDAYINSEFKTDIFLPEKEIAIFKSQFENSVL